MGEAHKIGDSVKPIGDADVNPGAGHFDVLKLWKDDRRFHVGAYSADSSEGGKIEAAAKNFATEITKGNYTDNEVAKRFAGAVQGFGGQDVSQLTVAFNAALTEKGAPWHVEGSRSGNEGRVWLYANHPEYDKKVIVKSEFFKPGENMDADFTPDNAAVAKLATDFVQKNPDHLSPEALTAAVTKTIDAMKAAGAGPHHADRAINKALKDSGQALEMSINSKGRIKVWPNHENLPVTEVELTKL